MVMVDKVRVKVEVDKVKVEAVKVRAEVQPDRVRVEVVDVVKVRAGVVVVVLNYRPRRQWKGDGTDVAGIRTRTLVVVASSLDRDGFRQPHGMVAQLRIR